MFKAFKPVPVAEAAVLADDLPPHAASYAQDTVTLGWEERLKARGLRHSDRGFEFATTLARGTVLRDGHCFVFDHPPIVIHVAERREPVLEIRPADPREWALFAYHIGNSHQPVMLTDDVIVCADLPGVEQVLVAHSIPFVRAMRAFTPVGQIADHLHGGRQ